MKAAMVLLSGGLDSTTVAAHAVREGYTARAVHITYGQTHAREVESARAVARHLGIPLLEAGAGFYGQLASYSAITNPGAHALPAERGMDEMGKDIPITYVPLRNTFFVTVAAAALESWLLQLIEVERVPAGDIEATIFVGANAIDYSGYPDCRPEFYEAMAEVIRLGSKVGTQYGVRIGVEAPIIRMTKPDIVRHGLDLGAPLELTWSCYATGDRPCGVCDACRLRAAGFEGAGTPDPALVR